MMHGRKTARYLQLRALSPTHAAALPFVTRPQWRRFGWRGTFMRTVYRTQLLSDAYAVQAALLAEGLVATVSGEHSIGTVGGGVAVHVASDEDAALARRVITDLGLDASE